MPSIHYIHLFWYPGLHWFILCNTISFVTCHLSWHPSSQMCMQSGRMRSIIFSELVWYWHGQKCFKVAEFSIMGHSRMNDRHAHSYLAEYEESVNLSFETAILQQPSLLTLRCKSCNRSAWWPINNKACSLSACIYQHHLVAVVVFCGGAARAVMK